MWSSGQVDKKDGHDASGIVTMSQKQREAIKLKFQRGELEIIPS